MGLQMVGKGQKMKIRSCVCFWVVGFLMFWEGAFGASALAGRVVTDMAGRQVSLPSNITKVYASSPPETMLVYALAPQLLAGLNFPLSRDCNGLVHQHALELPVMGGFFGQGKTPNFEILLKVNPDLVLGSTRNPLTEKLEAKLNRFDIPMVYISLEPLANYPNAFELVGRVLNRKERAKQLAENTRAVLSEVAEKVAGIPPGKRVRVYYAQGNDGLLTENRQSFHAELINLAGGVNVHQSSYVSQYGREKISLEKVIMYQPDVILVDNPLFYSRVFESPGWNNLEAVRNKRVYYIPKLPFNWFDRPPSFMRILGLKWVANKLYPEVFDWDMRKETRDFFALYMQKDITDADITELLKAPEVK